jgi:predicted ArsR family transcriptional regulator
MSGMLWYQRFFATTRGQMLQRLRRGARTVDDLARALDLTDNAIRAHLAVLERDGLVTEAGRRRTPDSRKPSQEYQLTPAAERLFPKPYDRVLRRLLSVLRERFPRADVETAVREVGRRLAEEAGAGAQAGIGDTRARLGAAVASLNELGALAQVVEEDGVLSIRATSCALAAVAPGHPEVCLLTEEFVGSVSGLAVCQHCERTDPPRCRFDVLAS